MDTNENNILYKDLSYKIFGFAMRVNSSLGYGFLEKVSENALMVLQSNWTVFSSNIKELLNNYS